MRLTLVLASVLAASSAALAAPNPSGGHEGEPCYGDDMCYHGNRCLAETKKCIASNKREGDSCTYDEECSKSACQDSICTVTEHGFGSKCTGSNECDPGLTCTLDDWLDDYKICTHRTPGQAWTDCHHDGHCTHGHECISSSQGQKYCGKGKCTAVGLFCTSSTSCCDGLSCSPKGELPIPTCQ